jgi:hypothetical protein
MVCQLCGNETKHSHVTHIAMGVRTYDCPSYFPYRVHIGPQPVAASDSERPDTKGDDDEC